MIFPTVRPYFRSCPDKMNVDIDMNSAVFKISEYWYSICTLTINICASVPLTISHASDTLLLPRGADMHGGGPGHPLEDFALSHGVPKCLATVLVLSHGPEDH